jgi:hypothetical protein
MSWLVAGSGIAFGFVLFVAVLLTIVFLRPRDGREAAIFQLPGATVAITLLLVMLTITSVGLVAGGWSALP